MSSKRAWIVKCAGVRSIVIANSRNQARRIVQLSALDAGFNADDWIKITAHRVKCYDKLPHGSGPLSIEIANLMLKHASKS